MLGERRMESEELLAEAGEARWTCLTEKRYQATWQSRDKKYELVQMQELAMNKTELLIKHL